MTEAADQPETAPHSCPHCGQPAPETASWCEACGSDLQAAPNEARPAMPCVACGAASSSISGDGWCEQCGQRQPLPRDHYTRDHGVVAGASDKGRVHHRNEDALAVAVTATATAIVVCDGVSSTDRPDEASQAAADAAAAILSDGNSVGTDAALLERAAAAAQRAVIEVAADGDGDPPSCTLVATLARTTDTAVDVVIGWIGDSRAYWIDAANPSASQLLTTDHSWSEVQRSLGELSEEEIAADPRKHSITRWIGVDAQDVVPEIREFSFPRGSGQLVVCSDGLWNYAPAPEQLAAQVAATEGTLVDIAEALVAFANAAGGHDNITVALTEIAAPAPASP